MSLKIPLESSISQQSNQIHFFITEKWLFSQMFYLLQVNKKLYTKIKKINSLWNWKFWLTKEEMGHKLFSFCSTIIPTKAHKLKSDKCILPI